MAEEVLPQQMDTVFSSMISGEEVVRIERIQLDLGRISTQNFEREFQEKVILQLRKQLTIVLEHRKNDVGEEGVRSASAESVLEAFLFFLRNGVLPWWQEKIDMPEWEKKIWSAAESIGAERLSAVTEDARKSPVAAERFALQLSDEFKFLWFEKISGISAVRIGRWKEAFKKIKEALEINDSFQWQKQFWQSSFEVLPGEMNEEQVLADIAFDFFTAWLKEDHSKQSVRDIHQLFSVRKEIIRGFITDPSVEVSIIATVVMNWLSEYSEKDKSEILRDELLSSEHREDQLMREQEQIKYPEKPVEFKKKSVDKKLHDAIFISNAGLIILHPFIEMLFSEFKLLDEFGYLKGESVSKAVHILQYLCTGKEDAAEFDLVLNKLLCGILIGEPVERNVILSGEERAACAQLLESVIKHWSVLKNTSPAALQNTFLQRRGKIEFRDDTWWLKVEQKTEDILLDRLPWSISRIRLRWMKHWIRVEW